LIVSIEAGVTLGWERYTGNRGLNIGVDSFGASAPIEALYDHFGLTAPKVAARVRARLAS
jgi:transketolase